MMDFTGDMDPALSDGDGGLFSASSPSALDASSDSFVKPSVELTEFPCLRLILEGFDDAGAACEWRPSVLDR